MKIKLSITLSCAFILMSCSCGTNSSNTVVPIQNLYVTNAGSNNISMYSINNNNGQLTALSPAVIPTESIPFGMQINNAGTFVYVANMSSNAVSMYSRNTSTGLLTSLNPIAIATQNPTSAAFITLSPNGAYLYVNGPSTDNTLSMYTITNTTGLLVPLNPSFMTIGSGASNSIGAITFTQSGQYGYIANTLDGNIYQYALNSSTGQLTPLTPVTVATGGAPNTITIDPSGKYMYVLSATSNIIYMYNINANTGQLTPLAPATISTGNMATSITFNSTGNYVYVTNYLDNTVSMYNMNLSNGQLTALSPATVTTESGPWAIDFNATGTYAYVSNNVSNTVSMYRVNSGQLIPLNPAAIATGIAPSTVVSY